MLLYQWYIKHQWILKTDLICDFFQMGLISLKEFYTVNWWYWIHIYCTKMSILYSNIATNACEEIK